MDKGHSSAAEKLMTTHTTVAAEECINSGKDDVVTTGAAKKEKPVQPADNPDASISQTKPQTSRGKDGADKKTDAKVLSEFPGDTEELLGSVTTYNCHGTRTSARVIQKMRQDQQTRPTTPPLAERESARKDERSTTQKTPSQVRANRPTWSNVERNHFFDALNEFGKDFEAIGNYINSKLKRRSPAVDVSFKSKDQVRQHYYQTYHKICKYVRFSDEVRKPIQELYALINYGEMRRKLQFVTDKHFMKFRSLVYHGHVTVRCKGKNIRIKTPSCKALRRLNQLDDSLEDIKLPSKIEVIVSPANMEAFGRVQTLAQNPRCRTTVPLHKKLLNFISIFEYKWRSMDVRIAEEAKSSYSLETQSSIEASHSNQDAEICFLPKPAVAIHRPLLSITEYLSSVNICLKAYEERMGIQVKGETLNYERNTNSSSSACTSNSNTQSSKRSRTESGSEKKSPEQTKRNRNSELNLEPTFEETAIALAPVANDADVLPIAKAAESSSDELSDEIQELLIDSLELNASKDDLSTTHEKTSQPNASAQVKQATTETTAVSTPPVSAVRARTTRAINPKTARSVFKPLLNDETIQRIRSGWTASTAGDITIGDLYVVLGHDSKLELDYYWTKTETSTEPASTFSSCQQKMQNESQADVTPVDQQPKESQILSNKLRQLLLIANLSERMRKRPCNCDRNHSLKSRFERDAAGRTFVANKTYVSCVGNTDSPGAGVFRQPMIPVRRPTIDPVKQLSNLTRQKMSRQVLVQRMLLPSNGNVKSPFYGNSNSSPRPAADDSPMNSPSQVPSTSTSTYQSNVPTEVVATESTDSQDLSTFLNSLTSEDTIGVMDAQVSRPQDLHSPMGTDSAGCEQAPSSVQSVDSAFDESTNTSFLNGLSPTHLLRESTSNSRWIEDNINDFSLTSLLGHLDEINSSRDILDQSSNISIISESSVDYRHKFQEIKALLHSQDKD